MNATKTTSPAMIGTIGDMRRDFGWTSEPGETESDFRARVAPAFNAESGTDDLVTAEDVNICDEEA